MTNGGQIKIVIGAGLDRSVEASFGTVGKMAERTGRQVEKAMGAGSEATRARSGIRQLARENDAVSREVEAAWKRQVKAAEKASKDEYNAFQKAARERARLAAAIEREQDRALRRETLTTEREAEKRAKIEERIAKRAEAERRKFADRVSHRSVRFLVPNPIGAFGMAGRIAGDLLHGAGVDFSIGAMASRAVQAQTLATQLSNQGYMPNEAGANSQRVAANTLDKEARATAQAQSYTTEQLLRAQTKFVDLTGNLDDSRKAMPAIAKLSGATGTDPEKMAEAWANVSRHIGDVPDKAAKVEGLMRLIAGQGRVGSIEIKDEAKDLGKIAAMADKFAGDRATTIGKLATLAQLGKAEGGAASSAQAATSVVSFTNTFQTPARVKQLMAAGLKEEDIFQMTGKGKNRVRTAIQDPFEIIKKVLEKTGGDIGKFSDIFKSVMSQRATNSLVAAFNSNGGRNMAAVDEKIREFGSEAALSERDVDAAQSERLKTAAAQAVVFQEKLDEVGKSVEARLLPALSDLAPLALRAAAGLGDLVTWAANNPFEAVGAAIAGAIARAGIESAFRAAIEKAITGSPLQVGSATLMIAAITWASDQADKFQKENGGWEGVKAFLGAGDESDFGFTAIDTVMNKRAKEEATKNNGTPKPVEGKLPASWDIPNPNGNLNDNGYGFAMPAPGSAALKQSNNGEALHSVHTAIEHMHQSLKGTLRVTVMNMPTAGPGAAPAVSSSGRAPGFLGH